MSASAWAGISVKFGYRNCLVWLYYSIVYSHYAWVWIFRRASVKNIFWWFKIIPPRLHQWIVIRIGIYAIRCIPNPITIGITSGIIAPVVAKVVCILTAVVGIGYFLS